ncbi:hypothetical protein [Stenotrophobium rhamnosiphilum]|uniref:Uncharacterized protein n=1 Tax=Stenotrophobium rhamnosiphilum TaxID=2029166 RepID=A0A2T5MKN3_9GAMM|nr:hypothetical protein [Stenotrophobium rhamnosiphilum]PTU33124.1 hypothetical protein CJD38_03190 [Stenotrophobium rhamnosiphilum]
MNKEYRRSNLRQLTHGYAGQYIFISGLCVVLAWQSKLSWITAGLLTATLFATLVAVTFFLRARGPHLSIQETEIQTKKFFGGKAVVEDVRNYSLVISTDWIAFRKKGQQDIIVNKAIFDAEVWEELLTDLKSMPFKAVI